MAGTAKRKNSVNKKPKSDVVLERTDQPPKHQPPFRFGKLTHNEAKLLSRDIKSTKMEDRNGALTIVGTKPHSRITAKLRTITGDKVIGNGHCKKGVKDSLAPETPDNNVSNYINEKAGDNRDVTYHRQKGEPIVSGKSGVWSAKSEDAEGIKASSFRLSKQAPFASMQAGLRGRRPYQNGIVTGDSLKENRYTLNGGVPKTDSSIGDNLKDEYSGIRVNPKDEDSRIAVNPKNDDPRIGIYSKGEGYNDIVKQEMLIKGNRRTTAKSKDKKNVALVKQKSKRIPTRHIKYVSELDENLRNKYRRKINLGNKSDENRSLSGSVKKESEAAIKKVNENGQLNESEKSNGVKRNIKPLNVSTQRVDGKSNDLQRSSCTKPTNSKTGRAKSAPVAKPASKNVESFLVRNGLIPKAGSKPGKTKPEGNLPRKKSVRLKLSRSRAKSLRKKNVVKCVSKSAGKDITNGRLGNGVGSRVDNGLSSCWKVCHQAFLYSQFCS